ncbi:glycosyltransferase family 9 protein [Hymenobacter taeanensis]|uniref:Glycosyltransferase family 9 protein n=1 Tax=Hymenobacter taeanensis TaxID=2735321 RepID=A0A6M6BCK1_9BACT|nr:MULTISPECIES: glycosyltransferase family 9 protein [Hymenobacter]QJX46171.1 glycosyltransferase family 9 protein [Hymenobacter taeanensis]UOQ80027.1 glycosyltransferase family 9 protein [Hymenobacter sp. 5414T-23]
MKTFLISRTDAIGDVVLTLPVAGRLKQLYPGCRVVLLGRTYTQAVAEACPWVDAFLNFDELLSLDEQAQVTLLRQQQAYAILHIFPNKLVAKLARKAGVPVRIGTRNRLFHWFTCNQLVALSRRHSPLHEAQLNLQLVEPLGQATVLPLPETAALVRLQPVAALPAVIQELLAARQPHQLNVILHPRSRGSAREWGLEHFGTLARLLHQAGHRVFVTGTAAEGEELHSWLQQHHQFLAANLTGQLSLPQLLAFIGAADGLVAGSTGPLHLAAALGRHALGLYPPIRPMHPGRWAPLGPYAEYLVFDKPNCQDCRAQPAACSCIKALEPTQALARILSWQPLVLTSVPSITTR